jgi:iron(III) transport system ATP-binding protein
MAAHGATRASSRFDRQSCAVLSVALEDVSRSFSAVKAVDRVNLAVEQGEFVTLLGPSGCGKTTTLRMVAGLETNDEGLITIGERLVNDPRRGLFVTPERRDLGMVFQSYAIWPHMTVFQNVAYPLQVRRRPRAEIRERVLRTLKMVEMEAYAERPAPALSGGQQQRVAIARALVADPAVLLLDEPLSNLDARLRTQMGDELRQLQRSAGITALYVTHDQTEAMALSDRVVVMQSGRVMQIGAPKDIYHHPRSREVAAFFGSPNLFPSEVLNCVAVSPERYRLEIANATWRGSCLAAEAFSPGDKVLVMVRPEHLLVGPAAMVEAAAGDIRFSGRVTEVIFRGAHASITIDSGDGLVQVDAPTVHPLAVGEQVSVYAPAEIAWGLRT